MSDLKPGTLVMLTGSHYPGTIRYHGELWVVVQSLKDVASIKSLATQVVRTVYRRHIILPEEQPDE